MLETEEPEAIVGAVEAGLGLTIISQSIVGERLLSGKLALVPLQDADLRRYFSLVKVGSRRPTALMRTFSEVVRSSWTRPS